MAEFLSELEVLMRREFLQTAAVSSDNNHQDHQEEDVFDKAIPSEMNGSTLLQLEELMRREFFTPSLLKSQQERRFVYQAFNLGDSKDSIRLLHLGPGKRDDPLTGHLVHVLLNNKPDYEALSYTWGSSLMYHQILTDEGIIPITASLRSALNRLRLPDKPRTLWVDAVCINQKDNEEKSQQILLMPKIYSCASRTVVHLGQESDRSDLAIKLIEKIGKTNFNSLKSKFVQTSSLTAFGLPVEQSKSWKAFRAFWRRPWFKRIWIIQEFLLGKEVTIFCGDWERDWRVFLEASVKINDLGLTLRNAVTGSDIDEFQEANTGAMAMLILCSMRIQADQSEFLQHQLKDINELDESMLKEADNLIPGMNLREIMGLCREYPETSQVFSKVWDRQTLEANCKAFGIPLPPVHPTTFQGGPLITMLEMTESSEATDSRDRLFALLSLANDLSDEELYLLRPDYGKSLKWVVCRYASVLVKKGHCMDILYKASLQSKPSEMPSWIGDWTSPVIPMQKSAPLGTYGQNIYRAAGESTEKARFGDQDDCLIVAGALIDVIDRVGIDSIIHPLPGGLKPATINLVLTEADSIFDSLSSYPTGQRIPEVKWRTLIGNKTAFSPEEAPGEYGDQYTVWREHMLKLSCRLGFASLTEGGMALFNSESEQYFSAIAAVKNYKVCKTRDGYVGLVPLSTKVGDQICVLLGGILPFVLRESSERPGMFNLVGGCYIHGMMNGEAFTLPHWQERDLYLH